MIRSWVRRSFRNRIFLTVLLAALVPLLLCDVLMTQVMIARSEHTLREEAQQEMAQLEGRLDGLLEMSELVLGLCEKARKEAGIFFAADEG